ncbi:putative D-alanine--D-alanine ligase [Desulfamplus magnetovallimortis]|uniref:D-alanine--D-alanine ligase n=1 Tax=Desulfamplus magnetovallimortis TaxID=1246637 RepID=A0A1W1HDZ8_9BACT|nr:D-alanine--D-alanine ligase [Desulfamplus magnetovallimortis]SLM30595.1 putative D-alanine--D-alanine ligase [Desulfamplus magnetovallimortis]
MSSTTNFSSKSTNHMSNETKEECLHDKADFHENTRHNKNHTPKKDKIDILLAFGGLSREHNVSIISASNIIPHIDPEKYNLNLLYITKEGKWLLCDKYQFKTECDFPDEIIPTIKGIPVYLPIGQGKVSHLYSQESGKIAKIDLVLTLLHGRNGAGGVMNAIWNSVGIPNVGPSMAGGVIGFDKDIMKRLLSEAGLPICRYELIHQKNYSPSSLKDLKSKFSYPFFIKPANSGSSLGVHKIYNDQEFYEKVNDVFLFDNKLIIEEYIDGSELEIYCYEAENIIKTSIIRQTIVGAEYDFYTFEAKYGTDNATTNIKKIPADIPEEDHEKVRQMVIKAYKVLEGRGETRMDLFYSGQGDIYINEINTVPALMSRKSQPSLWDGCGISHGMIIDELIASALKKAD